MPHYKIAVASAVWRFDRLPKSCTLKLNGALCIWSIHLPTSIAKQLHSNNVAEHDLWYMVE